jgi:hypothetical protein
MLINLRNALMSGKRLPYDAEVEYIQTPGGANYIDTPIPVEPDTHYVISGTALATSGVENYVVGQSVLLTYTACAGFYTVNTQFRLAYRTNTADLSDISQLIGVPVDFVADYAPGSQTLTFNNSKTLSASQPSINSGGGVFSVFRRGTHYARNGSRVYSLRIVRNNVLVFDGIPVRKGTVGYLYDRVSGKLFGNAGTGDFVLGQDVVPVEYIESHGTEWIDTGVACGGDTTFDLSVYTQVSGSMLFGASQAYATNGLYAFHGNNNMLYGNYGNSEFPMLAAAATSNKWLSISKTANTWKVNGTVVRTESPTTFSSGETFALFCRKQNGGPIGMKSGVRFSSCKLFNGNGDPVRSFRPVRVGTNATSWEGAMMDVLTRRIYRNAGTGAFAYGNDLKYPIPAE